MKAADKLRKLGFKRLYMRKVPPGAILNAETEKLYPHVWSGSYYSSCTHFMVTFEKGRIWRCQRMANDPPMQVFGSIDAIIEFYEKFKDKTP